MADDVRAVADPRRFVYLRRVTAAPLRMPPEPVQLDHRNGQPTVGIVAEDLWNPNGKGPIVLHDDG